MNRPTRSGPVDDVGKVAVLLVDDDPHKLLTLETILSELGEELVHASSGQDALRCALTREFAVILLDINMPGMDGFETASLLRRHRNFRDTPLIFVTGFSDDAQVARSYSLGAVNHILTPIVPEVLRTKVRIFVELFKQRVRVQRQASALEYRAIQLQKLTRGSVAINAATSLEEMLRATADAARDIIGVGVVVVSTNLSGVARVNDMQRSALSISEASAKWRVHLPALVGGELERLARAGSKPRRLTAAEFAKYHPECVAGLPPVANWLAAPLFDGEAVIGVVQLINKTSAGDFTTDDEAILRQLAQVSSMAILNYIHADAREANRAKDLFLATLSHELRTPLNIIQGWTKLLLEDPSDGDMVVRGLSIIQRNVKAQTRLIEELLDVSRISSGKLRLDVKPTDLAAMAEGAAMAMRPAALEKRITVTVSSEGEPTVVRLDGYRMQQVLINLLSNAIKFTPEGGRVDLRTMVTAESVTLRVADTGVGISRDFLPLVFDRFRQADSSSRRRQGGLGLGLAVVRDIVELHSGAVEVASPGVDMGATFIVRLPRMHEDAHDSQPAPERLSGEGRAEIMGIDILLVEDDPDTREILSRVLERGGALVRSVGSAYDGLRLFGEKRPDVVISDLAMPERDGYEFIQDLRATLEPVGDRVPALALSAHASSEERRRAISSGFDRHAAKPIDGSDLITILAELVKKKNQDRKDVA